LPVKALGVGLFKAASVERSKTVKSDCAGSVVVIDRYALFLRETSAGRHKARFEVLETLQSDVRERVYCDSIGPRGSILVFARPAIFATALAVASSFPVSATIATSLDPRGIGGIELWVACGKVGPDCGEVV